MAPFNLGEKRTLHCQYGVQYYKSKPHTSDRVFLQGTRKKGCIAHIEIVEFNLYLHYHVQVTTSSQNKDSGKHSRHCGKHFVLMKQQRLCTNISLAYLPKRRTTSAIPQRESWVLHTIHPELIAKIQELVSIATVEPIEVQRRLKHRVMCWEFARSQ